MRNYSSEGRAEAGQKFQKDAVMSVLFDAALLDAEDLEKAYEYEGDTTSLEILKTIFPDEPSK